MYSKFQIYGYFFCLSPVISHFIHLNLSMWFLLLVSTLHTLVVATLDKSRTSFAVVKNSLLLTEYAWNLNTLRKSLIHTPPPHTHTHTHMHPDCSWESQHSNRRIYISNFAIFKIATFWSYHLHLREKSRSFSFTKLRDFLVGSAHVRSQATVHTFMHAAHAVCMRAEDIDTRFKERA